MKIWYKRYKSLNKWVKVALWVGVAIGVTFIGASGSEEPVAAPATTTTTAAVTTTEVVTTTTVAPTTTTIEPEMTDEEFEIWANEVAFSVAVSLADPALEHFYEDDDLLVLGYQSCDLMATVREDGGTVDDFSALIVLVMDEEFWIDTATIAGAASGSLCDEHNEWAQG